MPRANYLVRLDFESVNAEVWINGVAVGWVSASSGSPLVVPVNHFLAHGLDTVGLAVQAVVPRHTAPPHASLSVARYELGQTALASSPPALALLSWPGVEGIAQPYVEREFQVREDALGPWIWQTAPSLGTMDTGLRTSAIEYLAYLHALLDARRFEDFISEGEIKLNELAAAFGLPAAALRQNMRSALAEHSQPPYALDPLDPQRMELRALAGGRLLECTRPDRGHVLNFRHRETGDAFFLPTMIGNARGRWAVLR